MGIGRWTCDVIDAGLDARAHVHRARDLGASVSSSIGRARWGLSGLEAERAAGGGRWYGEAVPGVPLVVSGGVALGNQIYHGDGDREAALAILTAGFDAFDRDLSRAIGERVRDAGTPRELEEATAMLQWWNVHVRPTVDEWRAFAARERQSWLARIVTSWDVFVQWRDRLVRLRENARIQGVPLTSAEPAALPQTITERGHKGVGSPFAILWTALKLLLYAGVGFAGLVGLLRITRDLRHGVNPLLEIAA